MPVTLLLTMFCFAILAGWLFVRFQRKHTLGENAPEQTAHVTIIDKQAIDNDNSEPGEEPQEYWIYVQKGRLGPKREFQVGIHYFSALNPGDQGVLTYRGDKFVHFAMQRD
ncbi:DUF2500 domain-containing protein [Vibrio sp. SCSIO 43136]|uniref:DUF2500 domain-containing protein n=1 Tax=Vibrio sp. SCSIO 43136 TaxID=2819101 RepID=UPI002075CDC9|nr:DUF2500 domain-containing protein [Vibrio sp. SCSIO 43136]USD65383.1 DUF2500 domain-containing protein [Vibrio sp. SCSIO 43136]